MTAETYERMVTGGPLYGGPNSVKIDVGIWIRVTEYLVNETLLEFNIIELLLRKCVGRSVLILEVGPAEEVFCFTNERAKDLNGISSHLIVKAMAVITATIKVNRCKLALRSFFIYSVQLIYAVAAL
jgi:hypothetical protein